MKTKNQTQRDAIRSWLMDGKTITPIEALKMFGCFRLSAVIYTLRHKEGILINSDQPEACSGSPYSRYWIDKAWLKREKKAIEEWAGME